jgi:hypothetical protein
VYFFVKSRNDNLPKDPHIRKSASDAWDKAQSLSLRNVAEERRKLIKRIRFEKLAERPDLVQKTIEESRAMRRNMERRINEL